MYGSCGRSLSVSSSLSNQKFDISGPRTPVRGLRPALPTISSSSWMRIVLVSQVRFRPLARRITTGSPSVSLKTSV